MLKIGFKWFLPLFLMLVWLSSEGQDRITGRNFASRSEVIAQNGMAATSHPLATQIAIDILKKGGSAIDAAIAANAALGLMEPTGCGIGGDIFAIVWDANEKKIHGLNGSGRSPISLEKDYFLKNGYSKIPAHGPLPVSVPGAVDGWFALHDRFGKLPMEVNLAPAISYAKNGFPVTELIAYYLDRSSKTFKDMPFFASTYMPDGHSPKKGEIFRNPKLAYTLELIASKGRKAFYKGEIAKKIEAHMKEIGGFITREDLKNHKSEWVEAVSTNYRGYDVWELPPNGQGIAALQMLNLLEPYDISAMGFGSKEYIHLFTEVKKLAFEDRAKYYSDPDFNKIPVKALISKDYAKERGDLINLNRASKSFSPGELETGETIYMTVADKDGNMISLIQSNYRGMGSGVIPSDLGFMLQDRGELFSLKDGHFNEYEPEKRPFHTIIPAFVSKEGEPILSFGVMGGAMQPQGHVQILVNIIDFGMNLQEAGDAPRIRHVGSSQPTGELMLDGGELQMESGFSHEVIRGLIEMGHQIGTGIGGYGGYQAIRWDPVNNVFYGASESRKDGQAGGY